MKCQDLMNPDVRWVPSTTSVLAAARLMRDESLGFLLVSDSTPDRLMGVVTDRDLTTRACAEDKLPAATPVSAVATTEVIVCAEADDVTVAEEKMREFQKSRLVVLDTAGQPVGVLSLTDLLHGDRSWRALKTARGVLARASESPAPVGAGIVLTASTPEDEQEALNKETVHRGHWGGSMKEFPG